MPCYATFANLCAVCGTDTIRSFSSVQIRLLFILYDTENVFCRLCDVNHTLLFCGTNTMCRSGVASKKRQEPVATIVACPDTDEAPAVVRLAVPTTEPVPIIELATIASDSRCGYRRCARYGCFPRVLYYCARLRSGTVNTTSAPWTRIPATDMVAAPETEELRRGHVPKMGDRCGTGDRCRNVRLELLLRQPCLRPIRSFRPPAPRLPLQKSYPRRTQKSLR